MRFVSLWPFSSVSPVASLPFLVGADIERNVWMVLRKRVETDKRFPTADVEAPRRVSMVT